MQKIKIEQLYGDQMNVLIAEHCMGWKKHQVGFYGREEGENKQTPEQLLMQDWHDKVGLRQVGTYWIDMDDDFFIERSEWQPSTDIKDAYKVLRHCKRRIPQRDFHIEYLEHCGWECSTCYSEGKWKAWHKSDTLPQAICLLALLWCKPDDVEYIFPEGVVLEDDEGL